MVSGESLLFSLRCEVKQGDVPIPILFGTFLHPRIKRWSYCKAVCRTGTISIGMLAYAYDILFLLLASVRVGGWHEENIR